MNQKTKRDGREEELRISRRKRAFGVGPIGVAVSTVLFSVAFLVQLLLPFPRISGRRLALNILFGVTMLVTIAIGWWSVKALPVSQRGNTLCTSGPFRYVRHPLYAAFLSVFNFGFALFLNNYVYVLWAILLHPVWHYLVRQEEELMIALFGDAYRQYQRRTGRFFPRPFRCGKGPT